MAAREPSYLAKCACGKFRAELHGEPFAMGAANCFCNDCCAACYYCDEKAKKEGKKNISMSCGDYPGAGAAISCWLLGDMKVVSGKDQLRGFKMSQKSPLCRTYTACCCTPMIYIGQKFGPRWRAFNLNCITSAKDGSPLKPEMTNVMGKFALKEAWDKIPAGEAKHDMIPWGLLPRVLGVIFIPWLFPGSQITVDEEDKNIPGLFIDAATVTEIVTAETYVKAGVKVPKALQEAK
uniref:CENP-V/GFA domain-containing protein n=1 Tax=Hemiselmis andersenii TaxID=464988 RepID=A0A6U2D9P6_HEMAN|mmetsp:Transcript_23835/g.55434  ORF Transcript_23835/g.55434 Transcript_23835/m.55434 type:complete len:236 (+) Transcript_23835:93-800(+)